MVLGVILGPLAEAQLRRTLLVSDGDWSALVSRPFAVVVLGLALVAVIIPFVPAMIARLRDRRPARARAGFAEED